MTAPNLTPATWKHLKLVQDEPGRFTVLFFFTGNPIDRSFLKAAGLAQGTPSAGLDLGAAVGLGTKLERWLAGRPGRRKRPQRVASAGS